MSMRMFSGTYDPLRAYPLGYQIPLALNIQVDDTQFNISSKIDFLFTRNNKRRHESAVAVLLSNTEDPIQDLANLSSLRRGVIAAALRQTGVALEIVEINVVPEQPLAVTYADFGNLRPFLMNALRGIAAKFSIPTADPEKCIHCPYTTICSPKGANVSIGSADQIRMTAQVAEAGKGKPYFKQLVTNENPTFNL
jgi:hypothetical protein